jgi:hypothetical protein
MFILFSFSIYLFIFEIGSCSITLAGLELEILLPELPKCWYYETILHTQLKH